MTQRDEDAQLSETTSESPEGEQSQPGSQAPGTQQSDQGGEGGTHGRPSDDSDPGHS